MDAAFVPIGVDPPLPQTAAARGRALEEGLPVADLLRRLRELSIEFDRTTCPHFIDQLLQASSRPTQFILCSALDADLDVPLNSAVTAGFADDVRAGAVVLARAIQAAKVVIVIDSNLPRPAGLHGRREADSVEVVAIDHVYPRMHPSILLEALFQRTLVPGRLPTERGVLAVDAAAAWVIGRLAAGAASIALPMGVRDYRARSTKFAMVAPELPLADILSTLKVPFDARTVAHSGEKLRKRAVDPATTAGLSDPIIHVSAARAPAAAEGCVRCNWCADVCPTGVLPMLVLEAAQASDSAAAEQAGRDRCIGCGLCDYVCPSRLPLLAAIERTRLSPEPSLG